MQYFDNKFRLFTKYFVKRVEENREKKASKYDVYFEQVYKVLSWEDNTHTLVVFLVFHVLFWLVVQCQIRFFGFFFTMVLLAFLWDTYLETREVTVHRGQHSDAFEEIRGNIYDIAVYLKLLREESPSSFCIGMSLTFLSLCFVGQSMSGYLILYLTVLAIFFVPLSFKLLPVEYTDCLKRILRSIGGTKNVLAEDELIPFISSDFGSKDNDLDSLLTDKTADSQTNSLVSGLSTMPSYLDVAEVQADIEEEDLIPSRVMRSGVSYTPGDLSTDSDSDPRDIQFEPAHFNDSSSEDEKLFGSGLKFASDIVDSLDKRTSSHGVLGEVFSNFAAVGSNLVTSALKSVATPAPLERKCSSSSSDSEFEIINPDDVRE